jgi:hypothetical protein
MRTHITLVRVAGELPTILDGRDIIDSRDVCAHIATRFDIDKALTPVERAESVAFRSLIHTQLHAAVVRHSSAIRLSHTSACAH